MDTQAPFKPTMYREPIPPIINAALIRVIEWNTALLTRDLHSGSRVQWLKYQNILWLLLLCGVVYTAVWRRTNSRTAGVIAVLPVQAIYFYSGMRSFGVDSLFTDIMAAAMLTSASFIFARGVVDASWKRMAVAGLLFGLLALTKAAFLPVFGGLVLTTPIIWVIARTPMKNWSRNGGALLVLAASFSLVVIPWLVRNYAYFSAFKISDRGGYRLYLSRSKNDQTWPERYGGASTPGLRVC